MPGSLTQINTAIAEALAIAEDPSLREAASLAGIEASVAHRDSDDVTALEAQYDAIIDYLGEHDVYVVRQSFDDVEAGSQVQYDTQSIAQQDVLQSTNHDKHKEIYYKIFNTGKLSNDAKAIAEKTQSALSKNPDIQALRAQHLVDNADGSVSYKHGQDGRDSFEVLMNAYEEVYVEVAASYAPDVSVERNNSSTSISADNAKSSNSFDAGTANTQKIVDEAYKRTGVDRPNDSGMETRYKIQGPLDANINITIEDIQALNAPKGFGERAKYKVASEIEKVTGKPVDDQVLAKLARNAELITDAVSNPKLEDAKDKSPLSMNEVILAVLNLDDTPNKNNPILNLQSRPMSDLESYINNGGYLTAEQYKPYEADLDLAKEDGRINLEDEVYNTVHFEKSVGMKPAPMGRYRGESDGKVPGIDGDDNRSTASSDGIKDPSAAAFAISDSDATDKVKTEVSDVPATKPTTAAPTQGATVEIENVEVEEGVVEYTPADFEETEVDDFGLNDVSPDVDKNNTTVSEEVSLDAEFALTPEEWEEIDNHKSKRNFDTHPYTDREIDAIAARAQRRANEEAAAEDQATGQQSLTREEIKAQEKARQEQSEQDRAAAKQFQAELAAKEAEDAELQNVINKVIESGKESAANITENIKAAEAVPEIDLSTTEYDQNMLEAKKFFAENGNLYKLQSNPGEKTRADYEAAMQEKVQNAGNKVLGALGVKIDNFDIAKSLAEATVKGNVAFFKAVKAELKNNPDTKRYVADIKDAEFKLLIMNCNEDLTVKQVVDAITKCTDLDARKELITNGVIDKKTAVELNAKGNLDYKNLQPAKLGDARSIGPNMIEDANGRTNIDLGDAAKGLVNVSDSDLKTYSNDASEKGRNGIC